MHTEALQHSRTIIQRTVVYSAVIHKIVLTVCLVVLVVFITHGRDTFSQTEAVQQLNLRKANSYTRKQVLIVTEWRSGSTVRIKITCSHN